MSAFESDASMPLRADVLIIGAGLTGLALACSLGRQGIDAILVERHALADVTDPALDGRVTAVARGTQIMLQRLGAWEAMEPDAQRIDDIVVGEASTPVQVHYDYREVGQEPLGWIVRNDTMRQALLARLRDYKSVRILEHAEVEALDLGSGKAAAALADGRILDASLIAVCEGKTSTTRALAGIKVKRWTYDQDGIVCTFTHERPHLNRAFERFFPDGPIATLPMTDDAEGLHRTSLVWALNSQRARAVDALDDHAFEAEVMNRIGEQLGPLHLVSRRWRYPLALVWSQAYTAKRLMLVGDCARGIHPLAGQGWNVGARDVAAAAEIITERARLGLDLGDSMALERYERWRRFDSVALIGITDGLNRLFGNELMPLKIARNLGLATVEKLKPLKRLFVRHAMGLTGDLPALMQP